MAHPTASPTTPAIRRGPEARPFVRWPVKIGGLGAHLPPRRVVCTHLETDQSPAPGWVEQAVGVRERRRAAGETAVEMAALAARDALDHAGLAADDVDLIIGASVSWRQLIPCTAAFIQRVLLVGAGAGLSLGEVALTF